MCIYIYYTDCYVLYLSTTPKNHQKAASAKQHRSVTTPLPCFLAGIHRGCRNLPPVPRRW